MEVAEVSYSRAQIWDCAVNDALKGLVTKHRRFLGRFHGHSFFGR